MKSNRPPDPSNATGNLIINGIALCCLTADHKLQAAFLRAPKHVLSLTITEVSAEEKTTMNHNLNLGPNQELFLSALNPAQETSTFFEPSEFDRANVTRDFRFLADLEGEVHERPLAFKSPKEVDVTLLTVNNAHFYSRRIVGPVARVEKGSNASTEFGMITSLIGADISCPQEVGSIVIENAGGANSITLEKKEGVRYEIVFQNICPDEIESDETDFILNYTVLADPTDITFDLQPIDGVLSGDDSCNPGGLGRTADLTELLSIPTVNAD